jgi:excisionase family DNA binding protein
MGANATPDATVAVVLDEPLLTAAEVAQLLRVPRSTVYEYARRRDEPLPSVAIGRHRRYYRGDVEEWLARRRVSRATG